MPEKPFRTCTRCNEEKPTAEFDFKNKSKGTRQPWCKSCRKKYNKKYNEENKEQLKKYQKKYYKENKERIKKRIQKYNEENKEHREEYNKKYYTENKEQYKKYAEPGLKLRAEYLLTHPCIDCGNSNPDVLHFDHVRGTKLTEVSHMIHMGHSLESIKDEIGKCEVRCNSCHAKRHKALPKGTDNVQLHEVDERP